MFDTNQLESELLELGLEDFIPLPEFMAMREVRELAMHQDPIPVVAELLSRLLLRGEIRIFRGHWKAEPTHIPSGEAIALLQDPSWYSFHIENPNEVRLYFINARNLRNPELYEA